MQNKGAIRLFAILLAIACVYYLLFTYVTGGVEKDAKLYAQSYRDRPDVVKLAKSRSGNDETRVSFFLDSVFSLRENQYLDSLKKKQVYNIGITKFTYEDCKEHEINLGLDLRGGMNVTLEISVADIIRQMSNNSPDKTFNLALALTQKQLSKSDKDFVSLFGENFRKIDPNARLAANFQTIELKGKIDYNSSDEKVLAFIKDRVQEAIETSEKTLRARIDKFGVTQPNIQKLESSGRILVELPGVKDKERVRKLLQGTANLEFWETYDNKDIYPLLEKANKRMKEILSGDSLGKPAGDSLAKLSGDTAKVKAPRITPVNTDSNTAGSLTAQLKGKSDSTKPNSARSANDTSAQRLMKENPLFAIFRPWTYQDPKTQQNYLSEGPVVGYAFVSDTAKVDAILNNEKIRKMFPPKARFLWAFKPFNKEETLLKLVAIKVNSRDGKAPLSGDIITDARKQFEQKGSGTPQIAMSMTSEAAQVWKRLTHDNIGKSIAIVLDNSVYSYPTVQGEIPGGTSTITGDFSVKEADDLINVLKAGKLPAPARIVAEETVGPTLGQDAIHSGLVSFVIALLLVLVFMGLYYNKAGWVADVALFTNVFFVMGILASLGAVLTLPGIAGIVLTIGMSVDANILIFERIREELNSGKGTGLAIKEGFNNAMSSIIDSNVTTLLLGIILYLFGTGPIQGFATTLIIGILTSLFSAIFITRLVFESLLKGKSEITFSNKFSANAFKNIKVDFVSKRKLYYVFSGCIILLGVIFFFKHNGFNLGVDFKGGRTYVVRFTEPKETQKVRDVLTPVFNNSAPEVKTYGEGGSQLKITTAFLIDDNDFNSESKVESKLKEGLDQLKSKYEIMSTIKVGETVSRDIKTKAIWAVLFSCLIMFIFIFIRFKKWQYGLGAVVALFHDVLVVLSCYTIFDGLLPFSLEIDQQFIAAILTVMSYSMTDTVVVFDRIREYLTEKNKADISGEEKNTVINYALNSTLSRTILTSLTIFFVLLSIFLFGGETIKGFSFALLIGIVIGTYSSICIATPIVIDFDRKKDLAVK
jgi:SecD/SecF fusion protein